MWLSESRARGRLQMFIQTRTSCGYNSKPVVQTKNTLPQLVTEKVTHQIQTGKSLLIPEAFRELDPL